VLQQRQPSLTTAAAAAAGVAKGRRVSTTNAMGCAVSSSCDDVAFAKLLARGSLTGDAGLTAGDPGLTGVDHHASGGTVSAHDLTATTTALVRQLQQQLAAARAEVLLLRQQQATGQSDYELLQRELQSQEALVASTVADVQEKQMVIAGLQHDVQARGAEVAARAAEVAETKERLAALQASLGAQASLVESLQRQLEATAGAAASDAGAEPVCIAQDGSPAGEGAGAAMEADSTPAAPAAVTDPPSTAAAAAAAATDSQLQTRPASESSQRQAGVGAVVVAALQGRVAEAGVREVLAEEGLLQFQGALEALVTGRGSESGGAQVREGELE
jgi:hypothetical protein